MQRFNIVPEGRRASGIVQKNDHQTGAGPQGHINACLLLLPRSAKRVPTRAKLCGHTRNVRAPVEAPPPQPKAHPVTSLSVLFETCRGILAAEPGVRHGGKQQVIPSAKTRSGELPIKMTLQRAIPPADCDGHVFFLTLGDELLFRGGIRFRDGHAILPDSGVRSRRGLGRARPPRDPTEVMRCRPSHAAQFLNSASPSQWCPQ
jgi:hypothetical protein